jgi:hypothetical protein
MGHSFLMFALKKKPKEDVDNIINVMQNYKWFLK